MIVGIGQMWPGKMLRGQHPELDSYHLILVKTNSWYILYSLVHPVFTNEFKEINSILHFFVSEIQ